MRTIWRVTATGLVPTDDEAWEALRAHKMGAEVMAEPKGARNPKQLRLFWALCTVIAENDEFYDTKEKAKEGILRALGHVNYFVDRDGGVHISTKSIAFEKMSQAEFNGLFKDMINLVCKWIGTQPKEVEGHVTKMIADKRYDGQRHG